MWSKFSNIYRILNLNGLNLVLAPLGKLPNVYIYAKNIIILFKANDFAGIDCFAKLVSNVA